MTKEIAEIIEKNLPAQVGEVLKKVIEQGQKDAETVSLQTQMIGKLTKEKGELIAEIEKYKLFDNRNSKLEEKEIAVAEGERNLKISILEYKLQTESDKSKFVMDVTMGLVRNTNYRRTLVDNQNEFGTVRDQYGNAVPVNKSQSSSETKTEE